MSSFGGRSEKNVRNRQEKTIFYNMFCSLNTIVHFISFQITIVKVETFKALIERLFFLNRSFHQLFFYIEIKEEGGHIKIHI